MLSSLKLPVKLAALAMLGAAAFSLQADTPEIFEGGWPDGTKIEWMCPPGTEGRVPLRITTPKGKQYSGILSCGVPV